MTKGHNFKVAFWKALKFCIYLFLYLIINLPESFQESLQYGMSHRFLLFFSGLPLKTTPSIKKQYRDILRVLYLHNHNSFETIAHFSQYTTKKVALFLTFEGVPYHRLHCPRQNQKVVG